MGVRNDTKAYLQKMSILGSISHTLRHIIRDCGDRPRFEFDSRLHHLLLHDNYDISFVPQCDYLGWQGIASWGCYRAHELMHAEARV